MSFNGTDYPVYEYTVLAYNGITLSSLGTQVNKYPGTIFGEYIGTQFSTVSGLKADGSTSIVNTGQDPIPSSAQTNLLALKSAITSYSTSGAITQTVFAGQTTFNPNTNYTSTGNIIMLNSSSVVTLTFDGNNISDAKFFFTAATNINFNNNAVVFINGASPRNVYWLAGGSITGTSVSGDYGFPGTAIAATNITINTTPLVNGNLFAQTGSVTFDSTSIRINAVVCYVKGSKILTEDGFKNIETIKVGEKVISKGNILNNDYSNLEDQTLSTVKWVGKFKVKGSKSESAPICIKENALDQNLPLEDLYVSPQHRIVIDGKLVHAYKLVNGFTIFQDFDREFVEYYHIELESHSVIVANGILSESYLDINNNRSLFDK
jgi:hypothetical protein